MSSEKYKILIESEYIMREAKRKNARMLDMYVRLCEGKVINKKSEAINFGVDERTIQRDIDDIRAYLSEYDSERANGLREIIHDRNKEGFIMTVTGYVLQKNMKLVSDLIENEQHHYVELKHGSTVKGKLWEIGEEIKQCNLIELTYIKQMPLKETVKRVVESVSVFF